MVRRDRIRRFKDNPRKKFDEEELKQLALSIKRIGRRSRFVASPRASRRPIRAVSTRSSTENAATAPAP
jgi:hypothetical protein